MVDAGGVASVSDATTDGGGGGVGMDGVDGAVPSSLNASAGLVDLNDVVGDFDDYWMPLIMSLLAGLSTCLGAAVVFFFRVPAENRRDNRGDDDDDDGGDGGKTTTTTLTDGHMSLSLALAGSVMATVSAVSILPESFRDEGASRERGEFVFIPATSRYFWERIFSLALGSGLYFLLSKCAFPEPDAILGLDEEATDKAAGAAGGGVGNGSIDDDDDDDHDDGNDGDDNMEPLLTAPSPAGKEERSNGDNDERSKNCIRRRSTGGGGGETGGIGNDDGGAGEDMERGNNNNNNDREPPSPWAKTNGLVQRLRMNLTRGASPVAATAATTSSRTTAGGTTTSPIRRGYGNENAVLPMRRIRLCASACYSRARECLSKCCPSASYASGVDLTSRDARRAWRVAMLLFVSVAVHNFPEGLAVAASSLHSPQLGATTAVAIAVHNVPEGIAIAIPCAAARPESPWLAFGLACASGLAEPLGAAAALFFLHNRDGEHGTSLPPTSPLLNMNNVLAFVAGVMITVSAVELFPEAMRYSKKQQQQREQRSRRRNQIIMMRPSSSSSPSGSPPATATATTSSFASSFASSPYVKCRDISLRFPVLVGTITGVIIMIGSDMYLDS